MNDPAKNQISLVPFTFQEKNEPPRGKPRGIFKGKINFIAAPLGGISASLQQAAGN
jgi:hypothetical protein